MEVAIRWEQISFVAYNFGHPTPWCSPMWSTRIGTTDIEEVFDLFRSSNITILPARE